MTIRCFVAVPVSAELRTAVSTLQAALRPHIDRAKWVNPDLMHLTVRFIGDIDRDLATELCTGVTQAVTSISPFTLQAAGVGAFPSANRARVLWADIRPRNHAGWRAVVDAVERVVISCGLPPADKLALPHLTIARLRQPVRGQLLPELLSQWDEQVWGPVAVREVRVYRSQLTPQGPLYDVLAECQLCTDCTD